MVTGRVNWPRFQTELDELKVLRMSFLDFTLTYCPRKMNKKADLLARNAHVKKAVFSTISISISYRFSDSINF